VRAEILAEIWEQERGSLPELRAMTPERLVRCRERLRNAASGDGHDSSRTEFLRDFREAVRRAAATPFLCGAGPAGWRANFDWIIANDTKYVKILEGRYDSGEGAHDASHAASGNSDVGAGLAPPGAARHAGAPAWIAERAAREESVRRELRVGAGPVLDCAVSPASAQQSCAATRGDATRPAIRAGVVERFRRRGQGIA
jgi:hypothetical protein